MTVAGDLPSFIRHSSHYTYSIMRIRRAGIFVHSSLIILCESTTVLFSIVSVLYELQDDGSLWILNV